MVGTIISHYRILEKLGEGGMGVVYKAEDTRLERLVALKFLPSHLSASEQDKARFIQEAKASATLNHPNICTIHDIEEHENQMFIVMEFVDGQTLREKRGTLSFKQSIDIGVQIADGLAAAHERGIVHRDIKPENIMIRKDGIAQIMDFGLAKLRGVSRLTKEGSTVGTAGYMSPEQVQGQDADHRSDIFSLGVLLYEMFTGQLPFRGEHETAMMYEIVNVDPPPMATIKPEIEPMLDGIVMECLSKEPAERYQSVAEVAKELRRIKRESTRNRATRTMVVGQFSKAAGQTAEHPGQKRRINNMLWPALSVLLATAVLMLGWLLWKKSPTSARPVMRASIDLPTDAPMNGGGVGLDISPDGRYMVYSAQTSSTTQLYIRQMDQLEAQPLPGTQGGVYPFFSPDGQWVAFHVGDKLRKVSVFGGAPEDVCNTDGLIRGGYWSPNDMIYFGHLNKSIIGVSARGGIPEAVTTLDSASGEISHRFPELLPDGKTVLFTVKLNNISTFDEAAIAVQKLGGGERKTVIRGGAFARYVPTGHIVYVRGKSIFAVPFDADKLEVEGPPLQLFDGGWFNPFSGDANFAFSRSGVMLYVPLGSSTFDVNTVAWMTRRGTLDSLLERPRPYFDGRLSPDAQKVALTIQAANDDIWIFHRARGSLTRLTFGGGNHAFPIWSPDGNYVVYSAEKGRSPNLFQKPWDGSGSEEQLTRSGQAQLPTSFTPDGKYLSFIQSGDVWILPLEESGKAYPFIESSFDEPIASFSPDGHWMAYQSNESGRYEVYVVSFPKKEGKWQVSSGGGVGPLWSRTSKELFYINGSSLMVVDISFQPSFDYSSPRKVCDIPANTSGPWDISPDGQRFLMVVSPQQQFTVKKVTVVLEWFEELKEKFAGKKS